MDQHATDLLTDADRWLAARDGVPAVWARYTDLVVERGEGSWIETIDGERYLDYTSGIGVTNTGHAHPRVAAAIAEQATRIIHAQQNILYHKPGLELHERLPRTFPGLRDGERAGLFLANSGAEAVEAAVKLAKYATRRPAVIAFRGGFHGRTHGAMALTSSGIKYRGHYEPLLGGVHFAPYPYVLRNPTGRSEAPPWPSPWRPWRSCSARSSTPMTWPPSSWSRSSARAATWSRPTASCPACARSPTATGSCSSPTRCRPASGAPDGCGPASGAARGRTWW